MSHELINYSRCLQWNIFLFSRCDLGFKVRQLPKQKKKTHQILEFKKLLMSFRVLFKILKKRRCLKRAFRFLYPTMFGLVNMNFT